jgi:hypothetical protein
MGGTQISFARTEGQFLETNFSFNVIPYILESNAHPNLMRTQFLATS